jgi:LPS sulfotransferase NodH
MIDPVEQLDVVSSDPWNEQGKKLKRSHLRLFEKLAGRPDGNVNNTKNLLLLSTPRSGSTLFADVLNNTGQIGLCEEWFNNEYFLAWCEVLGCDFDVHKYLNFVARKSIGNTKVFALKWHITQLVYMVQEFNIGVDSLPFDHIVWLYRLDKVGQAISFAKATITNQMRHDEEAEKPEDVSSALVARYLWNIMRQEELFDINFSERVDARYSYERFRNLDVPPDACCYAEVLKALGKKPPTKLETTLKKQANQHSHLVRETFLGDVGL